MVGEVLTKVVEYLNMGHMDGKVIHVSISFVVRKKYNTVASRVYKSINVVCSSIKHNYVCRNK